MEVLHELTVLENQLVVAGRARSWETIRRRCVLFVVLQANLPPRCEASDKHHVATHPDKHAHAGARLK